MNIIANPDTTRVAVAAFDAAAISAPTMAERTMLVSFNVCQWGAQRLDRAATRRITESAGASASAGRFTKTLIDPVHLEEVKHIVAAARTEHAVYTLPWLNDGTRILPADAFLIYSQKMQRHRESFEAAIERFLAVYPDLVSDARRHLGDLFNASEYPSVNGLRHRFGWSTDVLPMPSAEDFRVELGDSQVAKIKAQIEASTERALRDAMSDAWNRLHGVVQKLVTRLGEYEPATGTEKAKGVFRDSLVENIRSLVEILPMLNIAGDANLASLVERARNDLCGVDAGELRDDPEARETVAKAAESIMADMGAFMGGSI